MWLFLFLILITTAFAWTFFFPQESLGLIAELKRQLRLWVIQKGGERAAHVAAQEIIQKAVQAGHDPELVKEILEEDWNIICDRLGRPVANEILGDPSPLERYG